MEAIYPQNREISPPIPKMAPAWAVEGWLENELHSCSSGMCRRPRRICEYLSSWLPNRMIGQSGCRYVRLLSDHPSWNCGILQAVLCKERKRVESRFFLYKVKAIHDLADKGVSQVGWNTSHVRLPYMDPFD